MPPQASILIEVNHAEVAIDLGCASWGDLREAMRAAKDAGWSKDDRAALWQRLVASIARVRTRSRRDQQRVTSAYLRPWFALARGERPREFADRAQRSVQVERPRERSGRPRRRRVSRSSGRSGDPDEPDEDDVDRARRRAAR